MRQSFDSNNTGPPAIRPEKKNRFLHESCSSRVISGFKLATQIRRSNTVGLFPLGFFKGGKFLQTGGYVSSKTVEAIDPISYSILKPIL